MKYDLKDIVTFTYVAKLKSFAKAARVLNISRTVASARIGELERILKISLLTRTTREVNLTSSGELFFDYCKSILKEVENLDDFLDQYQEISGTFRLVLPPYFSRHYIVPHLQEFLIKYPELKLDIFLTENPVNIISEGYDLQVRIQIPDEEDLEVAKLMKNKKLVCAAPKYIKKYGEPLNPRDLLNHNCLIFGENDVWKFKNKTNREIIALRDMEGNVRCNNGEIIKELVLDGVGITLKSFVDVEEEIKSRKLMVLLKDYEILNKTEFYAVYPALKYMSPKTNAFIEFFRRKLNG